MNILVLGGTGFISRALVLSCLDKGHEVTTFTRRGEGDLPPQVTLLVGDRYSEPSLRQALQGRRFDAVFDVLAFCSRDIDLSFRTLWRQVGHYIVLSTAGVYAWPLRSAVTEDDPVQSGDCPAGRRVAMERQALAYSALTGVPCTIVRPAVTCGPRDSDGRRGIFLHHRILAGRTLVVPGNLSTRMNYIHVDDLAELLSLLPQNPAAFGRIFNAAHDHVFTLGELIRCVFAAAGKAVDVKAQNLSFEEFARDPRRQAAEFLYFSFFDHVFSPEKAERELGFRCRTGLQEGWERTARWIDRAYPGLAEQPLPGDPAHEEELAGPLPSVDWSLDAHSERITPEIEPGAAAEAIVPDAAAELDRLLLLQALYLAGRPCTLPDLARRVVKLQREFQEEEGGFAEASLKALEQEGRVLREVSPEQVETHRLSPAGFHALLSLLAEPVRCEPGRLPLLLAKLAILVRMSLLRAVVRERRAGYFPGQDPLGDQPALEGDSPKIPEGTIELEGFGALARRIEEQTSLKRFLERQEEVCRHRAQQLEQEGEILAAQCRLLGEPAFASQLREGGALGRSLRKLAVVGERGAAELFLLEPLLQQELLPLKRESLAAFSALLQRIGTIFSVSG